MQRYYFQQEQVKYSPTIFGGLEITTATTGSHIGRENPTSHCQAHTPYPQFFMVKNDRY